MIIRRPEKPHQGTLLAGFKLLKPLAITFSLQLTVTSANSSNTVKPQTTTAFQTDSTTHIIENLPGITELVQNGAFRILLNTAPELVNYALLRAYLYASPDRLETNAINKSAIGWILYFNDWLRSAVWHYSNYLRVKLVGDQLYPMVMQSYRRTVCDKKMGEQPVYIMDSKLARAFTIKVMFDDHETYVVFQALSFNNQASSNQDSHRELPAPWQKLFEQLRKLPDSAVHITIKRNHQRSFICLRTQSEERCNIILPPTLNTEAKPFEHWDIEIAEQWCSRDLLKNPNQSHSIFSTAIIDAIASALANPGTNLMLPPQPSTKIVWHGQSAVFNSTEGFDYQVGWSNSMMTPASAGYFILSPKNKPNLNPEVVDRTFSHWRHWYNSPQKRWSGTPLHWAGTFAAESLSAGIKQRIHNKAMNLICTARPTPNNPQPQPAQPQSPQQELLSTAPPLSTDGALTPAPIPDSPPEQPLSASTELLATYTPDYSQWGFENNGKVLMASLVNSHRPAYDVDHFYIKQTETEYLQSRKPQPRRASTLVPGVSMRLYLHNFDLGLLLAIDRNKVLAPYKKDINSPLDGDLNSLPTKRHPGISSQIQKIYEINQRRFPLLKEHSWGHIDANGQVKPPKPYRSYKYFSTEPINNVVILSSYTREDILGIIITDETQLLGTESLRIILEEKKRFEESLNLHPLPLYLYDQKRGHIIEKLSPEKTSELATLLEELVPSLYKLNGYSLSVPAFIGDWPLESYLIQLQTIVSELSTNRLEPPKELVMKFAMLQQQGTADEALYRPFTEYPDWLITPTERFNEAPDWLKPQATMLKEHIVANHKIYLQQLSPIKLIALPAQEAITSSPPDKIIEIYQRHARMTDAIIKQAQASAHFSRHPVTLFDLSRTPYAALDWIIHKRCSTDAPGAVCIQYALRPMHFLRNSPDNQKQYFNEIINPLFNELVTRDRLTEEDLSSVIMETQARIALILSRHVFKNPKEFNDKTADSRVSMLIKLSDTIFIDRDDDYHSYYSGEALPLNGIKDHYNDLAVLIYLHKTVFGDPDDDYLENQELIDDALFNPPPESGLSFKLGEVLEQAFYPSEESLYRNAIITSRKKRKAAETLDIAEITDTIAVRDELKALSDVGVTPDEITSTRLQLTNNYDATQSKLLATLVEAQDDLQQVRLPRYKTEPEDDTPHYNRLKTKLENLQKSSTLRQPTPYLEDWSEEPLVDAADKLAAPLQTIIDAYFPDIPDNSQIPDLTSADQELKTRLIHQPKSWVAERKEFINLLSIDDPQAFKKAWNHYKADKDLEADAEVHKGMLRLQKLLESPQWSQHQEDEAWGIINDWMENPDSDAAKNLYGYLGINDPKRSSIRKNLRAAHDSQGVSAAIRVHIEHAFSTNPVKDAITMGKIRHELSMAATDLDTIEDVHSAIIALKEKSQLPGAIEIEGMAAIMKVLNTINEHSSPAKIIDAVKALMRQDLDHARQMAADISAAFGKVHEVFHRIDDDDGLQQRDDTPDVDPGHLKLDEEHALKLKKSIRTLPDPWDRPSELKDLFALAMMTPNAKSITFMAPLIERKPEFTDTDLASFKTAAQIREITPHMKYPKPGQPIPVDITEHIQQVINRYYQNPSYAQLKDFLDRELYYEPGVLWRKHDGVDHVARTSVLLEAIIEFHKAFKQEYIDLFEQHPDLDRLLPLAMVYYDVGSEIPGNNLYDLSDLNALMAAEALKRDLENTAISPDTLALVDSALQNKKSHLFYSWLEKYLPDRDTSSNERLIRRLLRIPDSVDAARLRTVSDEWSFTPPKYLRESLSDSTFSMKDMDLDPDLPASPEHMADWIALMKTAVFWASLTGASPDKLIHDNPANLMPYTVASNLAPWDRYTSERRKKVISQSPSSLSYTREVLHDITRLYVAQEAGKTVSTIYQLRQIKLPEHWTTLDSFLHFTEARKEKLRSTIDHWKVTEFMHHHGTLTQELLTNQEVIKALPPYLFVKKVRHQKGFRKDNNEPFFEDVWELFLKPQP